MSRKKSKIKIDKLAASLIAIMMGLIVGFLVLLISNPSNSLEGFFKILFGGFSDGAKSIGDTLYFATPIIMTGLSVGFAFKTGLFNIGASGQFIIGSYLAVYVALKFHLPSSIHWIVAILVAMLGGMLWGLIPGILKAYKNVNEVISTIMMNYIAIYFVNMKIKGDNEIFDTVRNQSFSISDEANIPKFGLDNLFGGSSVNFGIVIAIICAILIYIILNKTTFGYELKACGYNRFASKYAGINEKKNIVMSMVIAGALAGIGGALVLLAGAGRHLEVLDLIPAEGFNGIPVALLGMSHPIGIIFSGIFIAYLNRGGFFLQSLNYSPEIITIIIAVIVYFAAFSLVIQKKIGSIKNKKNTDNVNAADENKGVKTNKSEDRS